MILDPAKLLLIGVVALVVLGPDKLPGAAQKISSLVKDLQKMRASVQGELHKALDDLPLGSELRSARDSLGQVTKMVDPRQALYQAAGLTASAGSTADSRAVNEGNVPVPGAIDLSSPDPVVQAERPSGPPSGEMDAATSSVVVTCAFDPSQN
jgi:sec-independent protein translocase protein TatB